MKQKIVLLCLLLFFVVGCDIQSKYLQLTSPSEDIIQRDEDYTIRFFVSNPTENTFVGVLEYKYSSDCLRMTYMKEDIEISPNERKAKTVDISYEERRNNDMCTKKAHRVSIELNDKSGTNKDTVDVLLSIEDQ